MPQVFEIPEIGTYEFPDDMTEEEIMKILSSEVPEDAWPKIEKTWRDYAYKGGKNLLKVYPLADALLSFGTQLTGGAAGGYAGLAGLILHDVQTARKWQNQITKLFTMNPISEEGKELMAGIQWPFEVGLEKPGNYIAEKVYRKTKDPKKAALAGTIVKGWPLLFGLRNIGKARGQRILTRDLVEDTSRDIGGLPEDIVGNVIETSEKFKTNLESIRGKAEALIDVEKPFQRIGAPEVGFRAKNISSRIDAYQEMGMDIGRKWTEISETPEQRWADYLAAEERTAVKTPGAKLIRENFNKTYVDLKKAGYEAKPFPESLIERLKTENESLIEKISEIKKPEKSIRVEQWQTRIAENEAKITRLNEIEYVNYPFRMFMEAAEETHPGLATKTFNWLMLRKRKTVAINDLVNEGIIDITRVDPLDIIRDYYRKIGRDIAYLELMKAAKNEGMAIYLPGKMKPPEGFYKPDPRFFPALSKYAVHSAFIDFLTNRIKLTGQLIDPVFGTVKMLQFYNPFFLPMYDVMQALQLGTLRSIKTPGAIWRGTRDVLRKTPEYWEAKANGLASKPFEIPWDQYTRYFESLKGNPLEGLSGRALKGAYRVSWSTAWALDNWIRQISYRALKEKGYSPRDAAQIAARAHSDYASIPPGTRRVLNKIFFTPTFKLTMAKFFTEMAQSGPKIAKEAFTKGRLNKRAGLMFQSGVATAGILAGIDWYMQHKFGGGGWKRDPYQFGRRYSKVIETDDGPKELVMVISIPANLPIKYTARLITAWKSQEFEKSMLQQNRWELWPGWRIAYDIGKNEDADGNPIARPDPLYGTLDKLWYTFNQTLAMTKIITEAGQSETARKQLDKEIGTVTSRLLQPFTFVYLRKTLDERTAGKMFHLINKRRELSNKLQRKKASPEELKEWLEDYRRIIEETRDEIWEMQQED